MSPFAPRKDLRAPVLSRSERRHCVLRTKHSRLDAVYLNALVSVRSTRLHVVAHDAVLFANVELSPCYSRMRPTWAFATAGDLEGTHFFESRGVGLGERHYAIAKVHINAAICRRDGD